MVRRTALLLNLAFICGSWISAAQIWASATLIESKETLSISAVDAYPQLGIILSAGVLLAWVSRYLQAVFSRFLASAIVLFLFSAAAPVWFDSAAGSLNILSPLILKKTGVSDWLAQSELIESGDYNHLASDLFILMLIGWLVTAVVLLWTNKPGTKDKKFATRIDNLPRW